MKLNNWEFVKKVKPITVKKNVNKKPAVVNQKKIIVTPSKKNTDAARQRLIEAKKKAAALRLNNQNNDIEIFEQMGFNFTQKTKRKN